MTTQDSDAGCRSVSDPIFIAIHPLACAAPVPPGEVADGVVFHVGDRLLKLDVCSDDIMHVA
jgi:hypothetical protein